MDNTIIPSNVNLNEIVKAISANNSATAQLIKTVAKGLDTFSKIDMEAFQKNSKNFDKISQGIIGYSRLIKEISDTLLQPSDVDMSTLLGYVQEQKDAKGEVIVKAHYKNVDAIAQFGTIIDALITQVGNLGAKKINLSQLLNVKINLLVMQKAMKDILGILLSFSNPSEMKDLQEVLDAFATGPTVVDTIAERIDNSLFDENGNMTKADVRDVNKSTTKNGRMGLIDVIKGLFDIINSLSIFTPKLLILSIMRINIMKVVYDCLFKTLAKLTESIGDDFSEKIERLSNALADPDKGVSGVLSSAVLIRKQLDNIGDVKSIQAMMLQTSALERWVYALINMVAEFDKNENLRQIAVNRTSDLFRALEAVIKIIVSVYGSLTTVKVNPVLVKLIKLACDQLIEIVNVINTKLNNLTLENINLGPLKEIKEIFEDMEGVQKSVIKIALLAPIFIAVSPIVIKSLGIFINFIDKIQDLLERLKSKSRDTDSIVLRKRLRDIAVMIKEIRHMMKSIIALSLMCALVIIAMPLIIIGLLTFIGFIFIMVNVIKIACLLVNNKFRRDAMLLSSFIFLISIAMIAAALALLSLALVAKFVINRIWHVIGLLLLMIVVVALFVGFGLLLSAFAPIAIFILIGVGIFALISVALIAISLSLLIIALLPLDKVEGDGVNTGAVANAKKIISISASIMFALIEAVWESPKGTDEGWIIKCIRYFAGGAATVLEAIIAFAFVAIVAATLFVLILLAGMLFLVAKMDLTDIVGDGSTTGAVANAKKIIAAAKDVFVALLETTLELDDTDRSKESLLGNLLRWVGMGQVVTVLEAILSFAFVAIMTLTVGTLFVLGLMLKSIANYDLDSQAVKKGAENIIMSAQQVFAALSAPSSLDEGSQSIWDKVARALLPDKLVDIVQLLSALPWAMSAMLCVGLLWTLAKFMGTIVDAPSSDAVSEAATKIITAADDIVKQLIGSESLDIDKAEQKLELWEDIVDMLEDFVDIDAKNVNIISQGFIETINCIQSIDDKKLITSSNVAISSVKDLYKTIKLEDDSEIKKYKASIDGWKELVESLHDYSSLNTDHIQKNTSNFIKFIDKVSGADINNLKETTQLFKQMAAFSQSISGDFDKLADALNEKIAPLLEKIQGGIEKIPETADKVADKVNEMNFGLASPDSKARVSPDVINNASNETNAKRMQRQRDAAIAQGGYRGTIEDIIAILTDEGVKIGRK